MIPSSPTHPFIARSCVNVVSSIYCLYYWRSWITQPEFCILFVMFRSVPIFSFLLQNSVSAPAPVAVALAVFGFYAAGITITVWCFIFGRAFVETWSIKYFILIVSYKNSYSEFLATQNVECFACNVKCALSESVMLVVMAHGCCSILL